MNDRLEDLDRSKNKRIKHLKKKLAKAEENFKSMES